jgi:hypothetical protein
MRNKRTTQHDSTESVASGYLAAAALAGMFIAVSYPLQFTVAAVAVAALTVSVRSRFGLTPRGWKSGLPATMRSNNAGTEQAPKHSGH